MLTIIEHPTFFTEIHEPIRNMIREKNEVDIEVAVLPKKFNAPPRHRQRICIFVFYLFIEFMENEPFDVAGAHCDFDIYTNRDLHIIELYRLVLSLARSLEKNFIVKNHPYYKNEEFILDPPDVIRAKLLPQLHKINQDKDLYVAELN